MFFHSGMLSRDSDEESAFMALSISMTTRMERETVLAERVLLEEAEKMLQEVPRKEGERGVQAWKCVCVFC